MTSSSNDTWRVRPDLVLTLGLRYEYNSPAVDAANRANVYNPATGSLVQLGQSGFPRGGYDPDYQNLAPRIGLAWSPGGRNTTVFRAAYGIHYDQSSLAPGEGLYFSAPYYNFNVYYPIQGLVNLSLIESVPEQFPVPLSRIGDRVPARPSHTLYAAVEFRRSAAAWKIAGCSRLPTWDRRART